MDLRFRTILIALRESEVFPKLREVAAAGKHLRPRVIGLRIVQLPAGRNALVII